MNLGNQIVAKKATKKNLLKKKIRTNNRMKYIQTKTFRTKAFHDSHMQPLNKHDNTNNKRNQNMKYFIFFFLLCS